MQTGDRSNALAPYSPLITALRWGTVLVGVVVTASTPHRTSAEVVLAFALVVHAALRSRVPIHWRTATGGALGVLAETVLCGTAIALTGYWSSPFVFTVVTPVVTAGFGGGFGYALPLAAFAGGVLSGLAAALSTAGVQPSADGTVELFLTAVVAAYARRLFGEAELRTTDALSQLRVLIEANDLLQQLNAVAQTIPASLELGETVAGTVAKVRELVQPDAIAIFLWDASIEKWTVAGAEGVRAPAIMDDESLPTPVRLAMQTPADDGSAVLIDLDHDGPGLTPAARIGIYAPLIARGRLVGVIAVESRDPDALGNRDVDLMAGMAEPAALAIDNARWFGRLRILGAEEERSRIARDLHDRVAQALAYMAFELDRVVDLSTKESVTAELDSLRQDVRGVVSEVRSTLYDLRTDVTDRSDLATTMGAFLDRVRERSGLDVRFAATSSGRLAIPLERELWRIGQEAVVNVERHARAHHLSVEWTANGQHAQLVVADDGRGFAVEKAGRMDSYGLMGMRERADAIGATLSIDTKPGQGTTVRCRVEVT